MWRRLVCPQKNWWRIARIGLALLLLTAAWAKGHKLATDSTWGDRLWDSRWFLATLALGEIGFALWLVIRLFPEWAWILANSFFFLFAAVNVFLAMVGET